jgi:hypothetical protein
VTSSSIRLRFLLQERHWQTYRIFCNEYDKAARTIDKSLVGSWPSRVQLHRWLTGGIKGLPYSDHCRVLEAMFPGWSVSRLFEPWHLHNGPPTIPAANEILMAVATGFETPAAGQVKWERSAARESTTGNRRHFTGTGQTGPDARQHNSAPDSTDRTLQVITQRLITLKKILRLSDQEAMLIASLAGNIVELDLRIAIDIAQEGDARVVYHHQLLNISDKPVTRLMREVWFKHTRGRIEIAPMAAGDHDVAIQRLHDSPTMAKFACQLSPAVQPGETAFVRYICDGGQFVDEYYWRQALPRHVRHLTMSVRHRGMRTLRSCTAIEEHPDGAESSAAEELLWDHENDDILITLTCDYLSPNQAVTLRWESDRVS